MIYFIKEFLLNYFWVAINSLYLSNRNENYKKCIKEKEIFEELSMSCMPLNGYHLVSPCTFVLSFKLICIYSHIALGKICYF